MKTTTSSVFLALLLLASCTPKQSVQKGVTTIDLTGNLSRQKEFFLSDIATDIEYVKLDNSIEAAIQEVSSYDITDNYFLIYDRTRLNVMLFDRQGKFLRLIGRPGKGPGEYTGIQDVSINPSGEYVYITHQKQINTYRTTGEFVHSTPLPSWALMVEPFGEDFLAVFPSYYSTLMDNYTFAFFKKDGTMGERLLKRDWGFLKQGDPIKYARLYLFDDLFCYNEAYFDTVYAVTPDRKVIPHIYFKKGKGTDDLMTSEGFSLVGWKELPGFILVSGSVNRWMKNVVFDRKTGEMWQVPRDTVARSTGFANDLDGGLPVWSGKTFDGKLFAMDYGFKMKEAFERIAGRPFTARLPERRKQLEELVAGLKEEDNQVVTIITLKEK